ncbi:hypothetical protein KP509_1Z169100 [Ceratopteris richardii]|nr:hypothetical protein KP509_1Z169100 [Ceratopteris richardii]
MTMLCPLLLTSTASSMRLLELIDHTFYLSRIYQRCCNLQTLIQRNQHIDQNFHIWLLTQGINKRRDNVICQLFHMREFTHHSRCPFPRFCK